MAELPTFIHLRNHTAYSLSEGALQVKAVAKMAKNFHMPALAITDTGNLFGALEFSDTLKELGLQPIIGVTLKVNFDEKAEGPQKAQVGLKQRPSLVLLAQNETGYTNLMALVSQSFLEIPPYEEPHVTWESLQKYSDGLICLSGGPQGPINQAMLQGQPQAARGLVENLKNCFDDRFYIELQRHSLPEENSVEPALIDFAYDLEIPLVATNQSYFARPEDYEAHDALICIAGGEVIAADDRRRLTPDHYFKSQAEMAALFADIPEAIENTVEIAQRCAFFVKGRKPILPRFADDEDEDLRREARAGLERRLAERGHALQYTTEDYIARLDFELSVIIKMKYAGYFLIVADFIKWAKAQSIPVGPGRGSGAGSLVAYVLTITDLDPLRFNLLFERFLNPDRVSMPDFDIDFCQDRRDEVIDYVQARWGKDRVAQIITFGKLQARMVTRDVGRVLQMPYGQVDRLSKLIPMNPAKPVTLSDAINGEPRLQYERDNDDNVKRLFDIALKLEGLYRNASTHAAGIVIGDRPLEQLVPLYRDPRATLPASQFNLKYVEKAGLVKFDFLGLKTLTVIDKAQKLIRVREPEFDANKIPIDDEKTFKMLALGDTQGVFQLESAGMRDAVRAMRADRFEDLIALVALYRPGPMANIPSYCARKLGKEEVTYLHPLLEPILKETFGIITYQEQVQQTAKDMAGFTLAQADLLRRAMGKKDAKEMAAQRDRFMEGAIKNGISEQIATEAFDACAKFAEYGFNKSHSAPYAYISYQTAYLKANYPVEFIAASMTLEVGNTDKLMLFRREAQRMKIDVVPPSINEGAREFLVRDGRILYALAALRNVGSGAIEQLVTERAENGAYKSMTDFAQRFDAKQINRRALESLVKAGAFDCVNANRARVFASIDSLVSFSNRNQEQKSAGQNDLFGGAGSGGTEFILPAADNWLPFDKLSHEFEAVGFYLSGHPLDEYSRVLQHLKVDSWAAFQDKVLTQGITAGKLAGTVTQKQERRSKQGNKFAFIGFSDPTGQFEAVCFSDTLDAARELLEPGTAVMLRVEADIDGDAIKLRLQSVDALDKQAATIAQGVQIFVRDAVPIDSIAMRLQKGGRAPVRITLITADNEDVDIDIGTNFTITPQVKGALKAIHGVEDVWDL